MATITRHRQINIIAVYFISIKYILEIWIKSETIKAIQALLLQDWIPLFKWSKTIGNRYMYVYEVAHK